MFVGESRVVRHDSALIALIDGATGHLEGDREGLTSAYRNYNLDACVAERLVDFVIVTSDVYP